MNLKLWEWGSVILLIIIIYSFIAIAFDFKLGISLLFGILAAIIIVIFSFHLTKKFEQNKVMLKMINEIKDNHERLFNSNYTNNGIKHFLVELDRVEKEFLDITNQKPAWIHKSPSFGIHTYIKQYLPSKAFYNLMIRGFYLDLQEGQLSNLLELYIACKDFSDRTTQLEDKMNKILKNDPDYIKIVKNFKNQMENEFEECKDKFQHHYKPIGFDPDDPNLYF